MPADEQDPKSGVCCRRSYDRHREGRPSSQTDHETPRRGGIVKGRRWALRGSVLGLSLLPLLSTSGSAQAILNVERLQSSEVEGAHGELNVRANVSAGNTDLFQIGGTLGAGYKASRNWTRLFLGMERLRKNDANLVDNRYLHLRYNFFFAEGVRSFHFVQVQTNQNLLLRRRWLVGTGLRVRALGGKGKELEIGSGLMYEAETLRRSALDAGEDPETRTVRVSNLLVGSWSPREGARLVGVAYYQPDVGNFSDYRLLGEAGLSVDFTRSIQLELSLNWRHDSRAPGTLKEDDVALNTGITYRLR